MSRKLWFYFYAALVLSIVNIVMQEYDIVTGRPFVAYLTGVCVGLFVGTKNSEASNE